MVLGMNMCPGGGRCPCGGGSVAFGAIFFFFKLIFFLQLALAEKVDKCENQDVVQLGLLRGSRSPVG